MPHPLDHADMERVIRRSPEQFRAGLTAAQGLQVSGGPFTDVLVAGMGGSWMAGALVREAGLSNVPIALHRGYGLPEVRSGTTLVVVSSFSGNTEETLSSYNAARANRLSLLGISAGGELKERCVTDGVPFVSIPADPPTMQPRSATGYQVGILTQILANLGLAAEGAVPALERLGPHLTAVMDATRKQGEALVQALKNATPIIYASSRFRDVARIWKIKFNENAKTPAFWNVFPELNHNEMIGWTFAHGPFHVILLRDSEDHPRVVRRFEITRSLLQERGIPATVVPLEGNSPVEKIFFVLLVGDWASYALALALGVDPSPVPMVEDLKKLLKA